MCTPFRERKSFFHETRSSSTSPISVVNSMTRVFCSFHRPSAFPGGQETPQKRKISATFHGGFDKPNKHKFSLSLTDYENCLENLSSKENPLLPVVHFLARL